MSSVVCFGEILLRLSALPPALLLQDKRLEATTCGAEANVAVGLAGLGHKSHMVSVLPENPLGSAAIAELCKFGVDMGGVARSPGRMGLYFLSPGAMCRPASIIYDREGSAFARMAAGQFHWPALLDGASWLFVSGITAALGDGPLGALKSAISAARQAGVRVAFDTNYRPSLWQSREHLAPGILRGLTESADLLFAGRRAIGMMLGQAFDHDDPGQGFADAAEAMFGASEQLKFIAATRREILSIDSQRLTGLLATRDGLSVSRTMSLEHIIDRIGAGDAFAAGLLHGLISGMTPQASIEFAAAAAEWKHSVPGDFMRASVDDILALRSGGSDVRR